MSSKDVGRTLLLLSCALAFGCRDRDALDLSATATAEAASDGTVKVRMATAREKARLDEDIKKGAEIDDRFPKSPVPWGSPSERVTDVSIPGVLKLEGGRSVQLDGVRCNEQGVGYLRRVLKSDTVTVVVLPTSGSTTLPIPADVWTADSFLQRERPTASLSYSNIVETAITSGWCEVQSTPTSKHNERYAALAHAFQKSPGAR